jgi:hypothetical protein
MSLNAVIGYNGLVEDVEAMDYNIIINKITMLKVEH